jgi:hypothetical protein
VLVRFGPDILDYFAAFASSLFDHVLDVVHGEGDVFHAVAMPNEVLTVLLIVGQESRFEDHEDLALFDHV